MLNMIDTILESTTEKGMGGDELSELCLNEELEAVTETIQMKVDELQGELVLNVSNVKLKVKASQVHLQNAMINLLENAIKYASGAPHITVGVREEGKWAVLQITDQGIGISKEDQRRIFDKFFRVHTGNVHTIKGYGLGLSYTRAVIERCGGEINVNSELSKGTTFTIKLPRAHDS
jgi:two-component system phosphate regulon sensor histidine kinase PhoR